MEQLRNLTEKETITSLEILEQINFFRKEEGKKKPLRHDTLLKIIRDEFEEEIQSQKILEMFRDVKIGNGATRKQPFYILQLSQGKQVLLRESKFVRRAVIHYIEELENKLKESPIPLYVEEKRDFFITAKEIERNIKIEEKSSIIFANRIKYHTNCNYELLTVIEFLLKKGENLKNFSISEIGEKALDSCINLGLTIGKALEGNRIVNTYPLHTLNHIYYSILERKLVFKEMNLIK